MTQKRQPKTRQRVRRIAPTKDQTAKELLPDMDLNSGIGVLSLPLTARPELANVKPHTDEQALQTEKATGPQEPGRDPSVHTPGISKLSPEQRAVITAELAKDDGIPMRAIARATGATFEAVKHLADKLGARPDRKLRMYGRRVGKRLPIPSRVEIYATVAESPFTLVTGSEKLRALERMDALEGIVTAREQRESESSQVHVGPLFVLPALATPTVDAVTVEARPVQDKA